MVLEGYNMSVILKAIISMNLNTNRKSFYYMKKLSLKNTVLLVIAAVLLPIKDLAQSANQNHISERSIKTPITSKAAINALTAAQQQFKVTYYDAFGRATQTVIANGSNTVGKDLVSLADYDVYSRKTASYLPIPFTKSTAGNFYSGGSTGVNNYYNQNNVGVISTTSPMAKTAIDPGVGGRVLANGQFGAAWNVQVNPSNSTRYNYEQAADEEVPYWKSWNDSVFPTPANKHGFGDLAPNVWRGARTKYYYDKLNVKKTRTFDANGRQSLEYLNKLGKVIWQRDQTHEHIPVSASTFYTPHTDPEGYNNTYFIYDHHQNLIYVIPPNAAAVLEKPNTTDEYGFNESQEVFKEMIYAYRYDFRGRKVGTKMPGKEWEITIYNKQDQPVLVQNGTLRAQGKWQFIKYDAFGRIVMTGLYTNAGATLDQLYDMANKQNKAYEIRDNANTSNYNYTNTAFPISNTEILTINYYDDYGFNTQSKTFVAFGTNTTYNNTAIIGLSTGALVKVMGSSPAKFLTSVIYYDEYNRPIQTYKEQYNSSATWDRIDNTYDFDGTLTKSTRYHTGPKNITLAYRYEYDHAGRKTNTFLKVNTDPEVVQSQLKYNEVGQLTEKNLHGTGTAPNYTFMQSIDYSYNENGWLRGINNSKLDNSYNNNDLNDAFGMDLFYENPPQTLPANNAIIPCGTCPAPPAIATNIVPQYNGNISATIWKSKDINASAAKVIRQAYSYRYDALDRLVNAGYSAEQNANTGTYTKDVDRFNESLTYDNMGNILNLKRKGRNNSLVDDLGYQYYMFSFNPVYTKSKWNANGGGTGTGEPPITNPETDIHNITSNKLLNITESANNDVYFNDFKDLTGGIANKYAYDTDGRLIGDLTKKVNYTYNHLDLPTDVFSTVENANLQIIYDATGRKLARSVPSTGAYRFYMDGIESEFVNNTSASASLLSNASVASTASNNTSTPSTPLPSFGAGTYTLHFAATEEGRVRPKTSAPNSYFFDYFLKDHLGNIRVTLSDEVPVVSYAVASFEDKVGTANYNNHIVKDRLIYSIPNSRVANILTSIPVAATEYSNPTLSAPPTVAQLNSINKKCIALLHQTTSNVPVGSTPNDSVKIWIPKVLKINSGDKISVSINAYYGAGTFTNGALGNGFFGNFISSMINQVPGGIPTSDFTTKMQTQLTGSATVYGASINSVYNNTYGDTTGYVPGTKPKAYMLVMFYDEDFNLLKDQSFIDQVQVNANTKEVLTISNKMANVSGYCQIAFINESNRAVYFDKLNLVHTQSNTTEINEYYPFGLVNQQTSSKQFGSKENRKNYVSKELVPEFGLNSLDYGARLYSPQIARWTVIDEKAKKYPNWSPYVYAINRPISVLDYDGRDILIIERSAKGAPISTAVYRDGNLFYKDGSAYKGDSKYIARVADNIRNLEKSDQRVNAVIDKLADKNSGQHVISNVNDKAVGKDGTPFYNKETKTGSITKFDVYSDSKVLGGKNSAEDILGHELKHAYNKEIGIGKEQKAETSSNGVTNMEEVDAVNFENIIRKSEGKEPRTEYGGNEINKKDLINPDDYKLQTGNLTAPN
jgi:RHS repeat-associated protein